MRGRKEESCSLLTGQPVGEASSESCAFSDQSQSAYRKSSVPGFTDHGSTYLLALCNF